MISSKYRYCPPPPRFACKRRIICASEEKEKEDNKEELELVPPPPVERPVSRQWFTLPCSISTLDLKQDTEDIWFVDDFKWDEDDVGNWDLFARGIDLDTVPPMDVWTGVTELEIDL